MKGGANLKQRDAKKLALANNARLKRTTRKKLEKQTNGGQVTDEMVSKALAQRNINQLDDLSRKESANRVVQVKDQPPKNAVSTVKQLPHKALKKNVLWLSPKEQDASSFVSLTEELNSFASYVQLTEKEAEARSSMVLDIEDAVKSKFPGASISQFGSHPVGLSIFLSDVDVSVDNINAEVTTIVPHVAVPNKAVQAAASQVLVTKKTSQNAAPSDSGAVKRSLASTDSLVNKKIKFDEAPCEDGEVSWSLDRSSSAAPAPYITSLPPPVVSKAVPTLMALQAMCSPGVKKPDAKKARVLMDDVYDDDVSVASSSTEDCDDSDDSDYMDEDSASDASNARRRARRGRLSHKSRKHDAGEHDGEHDGDQDGEDSVPGESEDEYFNGVLDEYEDAIMEESEHSDEGDDDEGGDSDLDSTAEGGQSDAPADTHGSAAVSAVISEMLGAAAGGAYSATSGVGARSRSGSASKAPSSSAAKAPKLAQDIDVPFWDGISPSASNAALSSAGGADGVLDETLAENLYLMDGAVSRAVKVTEQIDRKEKLNILQKLQKTIRSMAWLQRLEFRKFARVPIINLTHKNGVECDISLDMSQQATSLVVRALLQRCGPALVKLSAFLKIYLNQLSLDAPFTGGLGSYKLYVLLAKHIERNPQYISDPANLKLGPLLMSFLKFYGNRFNLNEDTVVEVEGAEAVSFDRTNRVGEIRVAFDQAFLVLSNVQRDRDADGVNRQQSGSTAVVIRRSGGAPGTSASSGHSFLNNQISSSALAMLLNTEHLAQQRLASRTKCHKYPHRSEAERDAVARELLRQLNTRVSDNVAGAAGGATLEEVKASNPALAARLRSFPSAGSAIAHLSYLKSDVHDSKRGSEVQEVLQTIMGQREVVVSSAVTKEDQKAAPASTTEQNKNKLNGTKSDPVLESLEDKIPVLVLQKRYEFEVSVLSPQWEHCQSLLLGRVPLPENMVVDDDFRGRLPTEVREKLGPFRTLSIASQYLCKSYPELLEMQAREVDTIKAIRALYAPKKSRVHASYVRRWVLANIVEPKPRDELEGKLKRKWIFLQSETTAARQCIAQYIEEQRVLHESGGVGRGVSLVQSDSARQPVASAQPATPSTRADSATAVPARTVEEAVCYQRILELESKVPILLVAEPFSPDISVRGFEPSSTDGKRIIAQQARLPNRMIVLPKNVKHLDRDTQLKLGPFRMLILAEQYVNKPYLELVHQRGVESAVVAKVRREYEAGSLTLGAQHASFVRRWTIAGLFTPKPADAFVLSAAESVLRDECSRARVIIEKYIADQKKLHDSAAESSAPPTSAQPGTEVDNFPAATASIAVPATANGSTAPVTAEGSYTHQYPQNFQYLERKVLFLAAYDSIPPALRGGERLTSNEKDAVPPFRTALEGFFHNKTPEETIRLLAEQDCAMGELRELLSATSRKDLFLADRAALKARLTFAGVIGSPADRPGWYLREVYDKVILGVIGKLPRSSNGLFDGATVLIPPACVVHRPDVDCSAEQIADLRKRIPSLAWQEEVDRNVRVFNPKNAVCQDVLQRHRELPAAVIVESRAHFQLLPPDVADRILPFRCILSAELYGDLSYAALNDLLHMEQKALSEVSNLYSARRLRFSHPDHQHLLHLCANAGHISTEGDPLYVAGISRGWIKSEARLMQLDAEKRRKVLRNTQGATAQASSAPAGSSSDGVSDPTVPADNRRDPALEPEAAGTEAVPVSPHDAHLQVLESRVPILLALKAALSSRRATTGTMLVQRFHDALNNWFQSMDSEAAMKAVAEQDFALGEILQMHKEKKLPADLVARLALARYVPRADAFGKLTNELNQLSMTCTNSKKEFSSKFPRTTTFDSVTYGQLFLIPPDCVLHRPGVDCTAAQVVKLLKQIPTLTLQEGLTSELRMFHPTKTVCQEIMRSEREMPPTMVVDPNHMISLPETVRQQLGPFRCIAAAKLFCGKNYDKLYDLLHMEQEALKEVKRLYSARRLRFSHPDHQHLLQLCANAKYIDVDGDVLYVPATCCNWIAGHSAFIVKSAMTLLDALEKGAAVPAAVKAPKATKNTTDEAVFNPKSELGMDIIAGRTELPLQMQIPGQFRTQLPAAVLAQLGPFSSLAVAQKYVGRSYAELVQEHERLEREHAELQAIYRAGDVDNAVFGDTVDERELRIHQLIAQGVLPAAVSKLSPNMKAQRKQAQQVQAEVAQYIRELKARMTPSQYAQVLRTMSTSSPSSETKEDAGAESLGKRGSDQSPATASAAKKAKADSNPHKRKSGDALPLIDLSDDTSEPVHAEKRSKPAVSESASIPSARNDASVHSVAHAAEAPTAAQPKAAALLSPATAKVSAPAPVTTIAPQWTVQSSAAAVHADDTGSMLAEISLSKPMVRRGPGGRGASLGSSSRLDDCSATADASSTHSASISAPAQAQAVLQQSREIQESIGAMKQQLDESRKRHSLG